MARLIENVYISNAKSGEDLENKNKFSGDQGWSPFGFQIGTCCLLDWNLISWSDQSIVQALRIA